MTQEFIDAVNSGEWKRLHGGLLGRADDDHYIVIDPASDYALGYSLEEAQSVYWRRVLEQNELQLPQLVREASEVGSAYKNALEGFQTANAELIQAYSEAATKVKRAEYAIKTAAECLFRIHGDKNPGELVSVKEKTGALEYDKDKAIEWCRENMKAAVIEELDVKAFESYSKVEELDFVKRAEPVPQGQIARKKLEDKVGSTSDHN